MFILFLNFIVREFRVQLFSSTPGASYSLSLAQAHHHLLLKLEAKSRIYFGGMRWNKREELS